MAAADRVDAAAAFARAVREAIDGKTKPVGALLAWPLVRAAGVRYYALVGALIGVVQFIKGQWKTGERQFFAQFEPRIVWRTMGEGFTWDTQDLERDTAVAQAAFDKARELLASGDFDLVVLDEINIALQYGYLTEDAVIDGLNARSERTSVILTGRNAGEEVCAYADLVSEMRAVKHPFDAGIKAVRGIDF